MTDTSWWMMDRQTDKAYSVYCLLPALFIATYVVLDSASHTLQKGWLLSPEKAVCWYRGFEKTHFYSGALLQEELAGLHSHQRQESDGSAVISLSSTQQRIWMILTTWDTAGSTACRLLFPWCVWWQKLWANTPTDRVPSLQSTCSVCLPIWVRSTLRRIGCF